MKFQKLSYAMKPNQLLTKGPDQFDGISLISQKPVNELVSIW